jgi:nicotinamide riboside transporter PnuC
MNWTWLITAASIIGTVANVNQQAWCFWIWLVTNTLWTVVHYRKKQYSSAFLFAFYTVLAVWGLIRWD